MPDPDCSLLKKSNGSCDLEVKKLMLEAKQLGRASYSISEKLPKERVKRIEDCSPNYYARYLYFSPPTLKSYQPAILLESSIQVRDLKELPMEDVFAFWKKNIIPEELRAGMNWFLREDLEFLTSVCADQSCFCFGLTISDQIVAMLGCKIHKYGGKERFHVMFIGYDRDLVNVEKARSIKKFWVDTLIQLNRDYLEFSSCIRIGNKPSQAFFERLGFYPVKLIMEYQHAND